jgi:nucleoside-diphosphate-sugar epimerase
MSRVLVTGGAGFIGSHLVDALLARGDDVVVLDDFSTGHEQNLTHARDRIRVVQASIVDLEACREAMKGAEVVFHQAALGSVPRSIADPVTTHEVNLTGTLNVLVAAREAGVRRVVYAASSSAYGNTDELPKREEMAPRPLSPYAVSKLAGEEYCAAFHASYGLPTVALRYFNVFGPRQDPGSRYAAVIPQFIAAAHAGRAPTIFGDGEQSRDFTYVDNVVQANLRACDAPPEAWGRVFNIGFNARITINDLWRRIRALTGATVEAVHEEPRPGDVRDSLAALDHARAVLGYEPEIGLEEGLRRTVEAFPPAVESFTLLPESIGGLSE